MYTCIPILVVSLCIFRVHAHRTRAGFVSAEDHGLFQYLQKSFRTNLGVSYTQFYVVWQFLVMQGTHRSEFPKLFSGFHKFMNFIGLYIIVSTRHKQMYKSQNLQVEQVIHLSHWSFQFCFRNCLGCGRLGHRLESRSSEPWQKNTQKRTAERAKLQHARLAPKRTCGGHISRRERPIPTRLGTVFAMVWTKLETIHGRAGVV